MLLSNIFSNKFHNLIDGSDNKNVIRCHQKKTIRPQLPVTRRYRVVRQSEIKEEAAEKNGIASHSEIKQEIESANGDLSNVCFFIEE